LFQVFGRHPQKIEAWLGRGGRQRGEVRAECAASGSASLGKRPKIAPADAEGRMEKGWQGRTESRPGMLGLYAIWNGKTKLGNLKVVERQYTRRRKVIRSIEICKDMVGKRRLVVVPREVLDRPGERKRLTYEEKYDIELRNAGSPRTQQTSAWGRKRIRGNSDEERCD